MLITSIISSKDLTSQFEIMTDAATRYDYYATFRISVPTLFFFG